MVAQPPSGTVTFLFSGFADARRRWDETPARMATAVTEHDHVVRRVAGAHAGTVFESTEDGLGVAFASAADAVRAAAEAQRELSIHPAIESGVRMGLHTGDAVAHDGRYAGPEAHRGARVMALGHGGQVLLSETTEALVRGRELLRPLGEQPLRGPRGRMAVFQLVADGIGTEFPVLRSLDRPVGNLPHQLSSLVGRDQLIAHVGETVIDRRLTTLTGVGGVGKTRLAIEIGADVSAAFADGVWIVELSGVAEGADVPDAIAAALGVTSQADATLIDTIAAAIAGRHMLLLLDNCEHVVRAAAEAVATVVAREGEVHVLATSREPLGVAGETVVDVPPLATDRGATSDAVTLFADRARSVRPGFDLADTATVDAITDICVALDGLPLGIELAAARMAAMSAIEMRDRLADRFRLLRGTSHGPARQSTLEKAVGWSYDLLRDDERGTLLIASTFAGGFDLPSMVAVSNAADEIDVLRHLDSLVRKSLITADHRAATTRYRLFETIREFAVGRLAEAGGLAAARDRHAEHFAARATVAWDTWNGPGWRPAVDWIELELDNLRVAYRWSVERNHLEVATDIAAHVALIGFSAQLFETIGWAEDLLIPAAAADTRRLPRLYTAAGFACFAGRPDAGRRNAHRATELTTASDAERYDACEPGYSMFAEALCQVYCGNLDGYVELTGEVASRHGAERGYALAAYADGLQSAGRVDEALALIEPAVAAARRVGSPYWLAYSLWIAGMTFSRADRRRALAAWDEGVSVVREHRVHFFEGFIARDAARVHATDGDADASLTLFTEAIGAFHRAGNIPQLGITVASVPTLFERIGRSEAAATLCAAMERQSSAHHVPELAEMSPRLRLAIGSARFDELAAAGAALDLDGAAAYAVHQLTAARRELVTPAAQTRPGGLSRREVDVLRLLALGRTSGEIANELFISTRTAEHHVANIYTKIGVSNRSSATRWAVDHGIGDT